MFTTKAFSDIWIDPNLPVSFANALVKYHSACSKQPSTFTTYAEFDAATKARALLAEAFVEMVTKYGANAAAKPGVDLIKKHTAEVMAMRVAIEKEYGTRIANVQGSLDYTNLQIRKTIDALGDMHQKMARVSKNAEIAKKELSKGGASGRQDVLKGLAQMAADAKTVEQAIAPLMNTLRTEPKVSQTRLRGAEGLCDDQGVGGEEKKKLASFKENMQLFAKAEELARETASLATLTKQYVKACLVLAADDKTAEDKTQAIMAKVSKKVDQAITTHRGLIAKNSTSIVDNLDVVHIDIAKGRRILEDQQSILEDKLAMLPKRVKEIDTLIEELSKLAPTSAKKLVEPEVAKRDLFKKDVKEWMARHEAVLKKIPGLLKQLDKRAKA